MGTDLWTGCYDSVTRDMIISSSYMGTLTLPGLATLPAANGNNAVLLVARYSTANHNFVWANTYAPTSASTVDQSKNNFRSITTDHHGHVYAAGAFWGSVTIGGDTYTSSVAGDMLFGMFDVYTGDLRWHDHVDDGANGNCNISGLAIDGHGNFCGVGTNTYTNTLTFGSVSTSCPNYRSNLFAFAGMPLVKTIIGSDITSSSVTLNGDAVNDGGNAIIGRGIIYGSDSSLIIGSGTTISLGSGIGSFSTPVSGLSAGTRYYVRTYITTSGGTFYGRSVSFTTLVAPPFLVTIAGTNPECNGAHTGSATVSVTGGTAPFTYYWNSTGSTGQTATGLGAGSHVCTVTDAAGLSSDGTVTLTEPAAVSITPGTSISIGQGTTTANLSYSATTGSPTTYSIIYSAAAHTAGFVDVTNATLPAASISLAVPASAPAGTYTGSLTVKNATGCESAVVPFTITLNVTTAPVITTNPAAQVSCIGDTVRFTAISNDPAALFYWEVYSTIWDSVLAGPVYSNVTSGTLKFVATAGMNGYYYRAKAYNAYGSTGYTPYVSLTIAPALSDITGSSIVEVGSSVTLSSTSTNPDSSVWSSSDPLVATVSASGVVYGVSVGSATISYSVIIHCGGVLKTKTITVNPPAPIIMADPTSHAVCAGSTTTFTASSNDPSATYSWEYYNGSIWQYVSSNPIFSGATTNTINFTATVAMAGWLFRAQAVNVTGTSSYSSTAVLTVDVAIPTALITGATTVVEGSSVSLSGSGSGGIWASTNTSRATVSTAGVVYGSTVGQTIISYTLTNACGSNTDTQMMTVIPANMVPAFVNETPTLALCINSLATDISSLLHVTDTNVAQTLSWSQAATPDNGGTLSFTSATASAGNADVSPGGIITYTPAAGFAGTETLKICVTDGVASDTLVIPVTIYSYPVVTISGADTACTGSSASLTASGATTYVWDAAPGLSSTTSAAVTTLPVVTTTYTVTGTSNGCSDTAMHTITVIARPVVNAVSDQVVCNGTVTAPVNFSGTATYYNWTNTNSAIGLVTSGTGNIGAFTGTNSGITSISGIITVTPNNNFCAGISTTLSMTIKPTPTVNSVGSQTVCNTQSVAAVNFGGTVSGTTYTWTNTNSSIGLASTGTGDIATFTGVNTGNNIDTAIITVLPAANGCDGPTGNFMIIVNPTPHTNAISNQQLCNGFPTTTVVFGSNVAGSSYNFTNDNSLTGLALFGSTPSIPSFPATNTGTSTLISTVVVTPTANGCTGIADTFTYTVTPTPTVNAVGSQVLCNTDTTTAVNFTGAVAGTVYNWSNSNSGIGLASTGAGDIVSFTSVNTSSIFDTATITVTPAIGTCTGSTQSLTIVVKPTPNVDPVSNQVLCNNTVTTGVIFTGLVSGTANNWTNTNTTIGLAVNGIGNISAFGATNTTTAPITANVTVTPSANGCVGASQSFSFTVNPTPKLTSSLSGTVCSGAPFNYTPACATTGTSFAWTRAAAGGISNAAGTSSGSAGLINEVLNNTTLAPKPVTYHYILSANACANNQNVLVTVNPAPVAPVIATMPPSSLCRDARYQNFGAATNAPDTVQYTWSATGATVFAQGAGHKNAIVNFPNAGIANVILTANATGFACNTSDTFKLTVSGASATNTEIYYVHDHFICIDNTVDSYQWGFDDASTLDSTIYTDQVDQNFYLPSPDFTNKKYWVMTTKGGCGSKTYYNAPTGVTPIGTADVASVKVFPNPATDNAVVEVNGLNDGTNTVELTDITGKVIATEVLVYGKTVLNVNDLASGIYIVSYYHNGVKVGTTKLVRN